MFVRIASWLVVVASSVAISHAQESIDGTYSCAAESSGGIFYNDRTKKWDGTRFRPFSKFVLKLKYARTAAQGDEYAATVTSGSGSESSCTSNRTQLVQVDKLGVLACRTEFYSYKFNLKSGRFIEVYLMGYVGGLDTNDDTPMVSGGGCTKTSQQDAPPVDKK
jgi:hypothetical protein